MSEKEELLLENIEILRVSSNKPYHLQTMLFFDENNYYLYELKYLGKKENLQKLSNHAREVYEFKL